MSLAFPKIWHLGVPQVSRLYEGPIEITEKIDGSQFNFGVRENLLVMRSKGAEVTSDSQDKLFRPVGTYVESLKDKIQSAYPGWWFHGETLAKPKHNTLEYEKTPTNHFALFAARKPDGTYVKDHTILAGIADSLGVSVVPLLWTGVRTSPLGMEELEEFLKRKSFLGLADIEGIVIKNYGESLLIGGQLVPILSAKYVSEGFKEKHSKGWESYQDKLQALLHEYRTEARWHKAVQHLRERGELEVSPRDIGKLFKEVNVDSLEEIKAEVSERLFKHYWPTLSKILTNGLPEWYKGELVKGTYNV